MAGCEIRSVYAGIAGSHIKGFNSHGVIAVKGGEVGPRDIERVIDAAKAVAIPLDREVIHILPQEFIVDDQRGIADPLGMAGVRLEVRVHIVTGAVTSAQNIIRSCHRAGLDVSDIVLESLASSKAVLTAEEREIGVALVDLGGGTTDLAIFANDSIKHTAVLALGGTNLTNDIAFGLRTPMASAEKIKLKYGCALAEMVAQGRGHRGDERGRPRAPTPVPPGAGRNLRAAGRGDAGPGGPGTHPLGHEEPDRRRRGPDRRHRPDRGHPGTRRTNFSTCPRASATRTRSGASRTWSTAPCTPRRWGFDVRRGKGGRGTALPHPRRKCFQPHSGEGCGNGSWT